MKIRGGKTGVRDNLARQLSSYWDDYDYAVVEDGVTFALTRMEELLSHINYKNKYVWNEGEVMFTPYNSVQYSIFLYFIANSIYRQNGAVMEADIIYYLNKIMNSCDWFYAVELPDIFYAEHPLGSILGRAKYGKYFFIYQGTTVGGNRNQEGELFYPVVGDNVLMYANSSILGNSRIGNNVIISTDCTVLDEDIPDNSIVFGHSPNLIIKQRSEQEMIKRRSHIWERRCVG